jgi:hypothetical protein
MEQFIPSPAVEGFVLAIFPGAAGSIYRVLTWRRLNIMDDAGVNSPPLSGRMKAGGPCITKSPLKLAITCSELRRRSAVMARHLQPNSSITREHL